jgi:hypothetical protein
MRSDRVRLGILAVVALLAPPCSALAQTTTNTDAAIAELRQLLADQRAMLDRQARIIDEQGRTLAALQHRVEGTTAASLNLIWNPVPFADIVLEYLAGTRANKDGERASSSQIQAGGTLKF